jgi:dTDP-4-dehydrorhamnose reductase
VKKDDYYCKTKIIGENLLKKSGLNYFNLRLPGILCLNLNRHKPWIKKIYKDLKQNKTIKLYNSNYLFNSVTDTREIFRIIKKIVIDKNRFYNNTYNLAANNPTTISQLIILLKKKARSQSKIIFLESIKNNSSYVCNKKISKKLLIKLASVKKIIKRNL